MVPHGSFGPYGKLRAAAAEEDRKHPVKFLVCYHDLHVEASAIQHLDGKSRGHAVVIVIGFGRRLISWHHDSIAIKRTYF